MMTASLWAVERTIYSATGCAAAYAATSAASWTARYASYESVRLATDESTGRVTHAATHDAARGIFEELSR